MQQIFNQTTFFIIAMLFLFSACGPRQDRTETTTGPDRAEALLSDTHQAFFDNLSRLCGQSFAGEQVFRSHHAEGWAGIDMVMHVEVCEDDRILIPFHVGEDQSRTWQFLIEDGALRFRHDHRHPDGTPEENNLYGGYADDSGTAFVQHFPADAYTAGIIEDGGGNIWSVKLDKDFTTFTYRLERNGGKRLRVDFDLTEPL
ncbi:MAG: hypothetical protein R6U62_05680 [Bacteroidales bacterium]